MRTHTCGPQIHTFWYRFKVESGVCIFKNLYNDADAHPWWRSTTLCYFNFSWGVKWQDCWPSIHMMNNSEACYWERDFFLEGVGCGVSRTFWREKKKAKNACSCKGFIKRIQHQREAGLGGTLTDIFNYSLPMYSLNGKRTLEAFFLHSKYSILILKGF